MKRALKAMSMALKVTTIALLCTTGLFLFFAIVLYALLCTGLGIALSIYITVAIVLFTIVSVEFYILTKDNGGE